MNSIIIIISCLIVITLQQQQQCPNGYRPLAVVSNKCIYINTMKANCVDAKNYCQLNGGYLTSISSAFENNEIYGKYTFDAYNLPIFQFYT